MSIEQKVANYTPTADTARLVAHASILLVAGIVCAGKDTVVRQLLANSNFQKIISYTTRLPRANHGIMEEDGREYHFISLESAERMIDNHEFIEVKYVHGNVYGTSAAELHRIADAGKTAVNDIDIHGVREYLSLKADTKALFLLPPSVDTWLARMERRYGMLDMDSNELKTRLRTAIDEIEYIRQDRRFIMIVNDDLATTIERIMKVLRHERDHTSDFAESISEHLLEYLRQQC